MRPWTANCAAQVRLFRRFLAIVALPLMLLAASPPTRAQEAVTIETFHDALAPYGRRVEHDRHGYVSHPAEAGGDWRPYTRGSWVNTEEHGWLWVSDEPWGWATYHYGR